MEVSPTEKQINTIVASLIETAADKNQGVSSAIFSALCTIGKNRTDVVLESCISYLQKQTKISQAHRIHILNVMERMCVNCQNEISERLLEMLISVAVEEMTASKDIIPEWQTAASGILVSLGNEHHAKVMPALIAKFQPGVLPHFFVVQTLANLATSNAFGTVPYLKAILGTMLPMLGMIKHDNMKWVFAYALARFSEAIMDYLANLEKAPDPSVRKDVFRPEIHSAYDMLSYNWLNSKEAKVRSVVVEALGQMTHLLGKEKLIEQAGKLITTVLGFYRRQQDSLAYTQGLCSILDAIVKCDPAVLDNLTDNILGVLFPQVCNLPDYFQPAVIRNHNEVLRCFAVLTPHYSGRIVGFLLSRLEITNERSRIGALIVIKHLLNSCEPYIAEKISSIVACLTLVVTDPSNKVKKVLAQVVIALAHHRHLEVEGGQKLIEFIITQCCLPEDSSPPKSPDQASVSNESLRSMCDSVLNLLATTVEGIDRVLWPHLFQYTVVPEMTPAIPCIFRTLTTLAMKITEENGGDMSVDFEKHVVLPKPIAILARMFVMLGRPLQQHRGLYILQFMAIAGSVLDRNLSSSWEKSLPHLILEVEEMIKGNQPWRSEIWEKKLMTFIHQSIDAIGKEEWAILFGETLLNQISMYAARPRDKYVLLKMLGIVLSKVKKKQFITGAMDTMFAKVNHIDQREREGLALAMGYASSTHVDTVLVKLEEIGHEDSKKHASLLSFIKDFKWEGDQEEVKATVVFSYGCIAVYAPSSIITARVETPILRSAMQFYQSSRSLCVKQSMLRTVILIAEALNPSNLKEPYLFSSRNDLLHQMENILKAEGEVPLKTTTRALALNATAGLIALDPPLAIKDIQSIIKTSTKAVYSLIPLEVYKFSLSENENPPDYAQLLSSSISAMNEVLQQLIFKEKNLEVIEAVCKSLQRWITSKVFYERKRGLDAVHLMLKTYTENLDVHTLHLYTTIGTVLGIVIPRATDPEEDIRVVALNCIHFLFHLTSHCHGNCLPDDDEVPVLVGLKELAKTNDPTSLLSITNELTKALSEKLSPEQMRSFVYSIMEGICDVHPQSATGACLILSGVIKLKGGELRHEARTIVEEIHTRLKMITCSQTRLHALRIFRALALHHMNTIISTFLSFPLPYDEHLTECWKILAQEPKLGSFITSHLVEVLMENSPTDKKLDSNACPNGLTVVTISTLASVCALKEIFSVPEMKNCANMNFDQIFTTLLLTLGAYVGITKIEKNHLLEKNCDISPSRCAVNALKTFLLCAEEERIIAVMDSDDHWNMLEDPQKYPDAIAILTCSLCKYSPIYLVKIIAQLNSSLNSPFDAHRIVCISIFGEILAQQEMDGALMEPVINSILSHLTDSSRIVRKLCIRTLGNMNRVAREHVHKYSSTILSALMAGLDDKDDYDGDITLEAITGLSAVLVKFNTEEAQNFAPNIMLRIRPMLEKERSSIRCAALTLFGQLGKFGNGSTKDAMKEQIHNNLVLLLMHCNNDDREIAETSRNTLLSVSSCSDSDVLQEISQKLVEGHLNYKDFLNTAARSMVRDISSKADFFIATTMIYLKSENSAIQSNAALLLGFLLLSLSADQRKGLSWDQACNSLLFLLKDGIPEVRIKAAEALGLVCLPLT